MTTDPGHGPDDMGDDEQETEVAEWQQYIEDPPANFAITEADDNDAEQAQDWADRHPQAAAADGSEDNTPAEQAAVNEIPGR